MTEALERHLRSGNNLFVAKKYDEAIVEYQKAISGPGDTSEEVQKVREEAIIKLGQVYRLRNDAKSVQKLLQDLRPFFAEIPKAKTGKIVRALIDEVSLVHGSSATVIELCKETIDWAEKESRTFLRLHLETKLAEAYFQGNKCQDSLKIITPLLREVKKLDDKRMLVGIHLLESRVQHILRHLPKARAALTAARTAANAIYCPPQLQAELDMQSGTLHAEEKDYKTAYSYFYESYENYESIDGPTASQDIKDNAKLALKYMLLTKIMAGSPDDVSVLVSGKLALAYTDESLKSMVEVARAYQDASLRKFKDSIEKYKQELDRDPVIHRHLKHMYQKLLEDDLKKIVAPFSKIEISHVAKLIELSLDQVEKTLSQMILDKKLAGILDQGTGCLILFDETEKDGSYPAALETMTEMGSVVDSLFTRASRLR